MSSPYARKPVSSWKEITTDLLRKHPLSPTLIHDSIIEAWAIVWNAKIGEGEYVFSLKELNPPATIIGHFLEKVLAKILEKKTKGQWRGGVGSEKDLHYVSDPSLSVEMKASGQLGLKLYGNRSYGQSVEDKSKEKKDKSGFYITVNFFADQLTLIRFGWIDSEDWVSQKASTGQMAGLKPEVYQYKLIPIGGNYVLKCPVSLLDGVGPKAAEELASLGIKTVGDLINYDKSSSKALEKTKAAAAAFIKMYGESLHLGK